MVASSLNIYIKCITITLCITYEIKYYSSYNLELITLPINVHVYEV